MSVQSILKAIYGTYVPTGVYSFEFKGVAEIFFLLPPESITVSEGQRAELLPTLGDGAGYLCDYGQEFKDIAISGSLNFFYGGSTRNPIDRVPDSAVDLVDGYSEFIKLRFMLSRYRDYTMTKKGKLIAPDFSLPGLASVKKLKGWVNKQVRDKSGALADQVDLIWHDYDYDDHFKVKVDTFSLTRSKDDPWTVNYDISLKAYAVDDRTGKIELKSPETKENTAQQIDTATLLMESVDVELPDSLKKDIGRYLLDQKLSTAKSYLTWANGMIKAGVMTPERALRTLSDVFGDTLTVEDNIITLKKF